jgi:DNA-binding NarL/FixJ family response regulator
MPPPRVRIVTVDDHTILRDGLRRLLDARPEFEVVGEGRTGGDALRLVADLSPDLLLLDLAMPDMSGLDVLEALALRNSPVRVVLLTAYADSQQVLDALRLGVRGLVLKESATEMLYKCINAVMKGEYWFGHDQVPALVDALRQMSAPPARPPVETLTTRETDIIRAIVDGATNRDVARQLGVTEQTIKNHLSHIYDKLGVSNRLELALFAIHHKVLERRLIDT